jgi:hypothetical protein
MKLSSVFESGDYSTAFLANLMLVRIRPLFTNAREIQIGVGSFLNNRSSYKPLLILQDTVYLIYLASFNDGASSSDKIMR